MSCWLTPLRTSLGGVRPPCRALPALWGCRLSGRDDRSGRLASHPRESPQTVSFAQAQDVGRPLASAELPHIPGYDIEACWAAAAWAWSIAPAISP